MTKLRDYVTFGKTLAGDFVRGCGYGIAAGKAVGIMIAIPIGLFFLLF
jgi:hypothetical protein